MKKSITVSNSSAKNRTVWQRLQVAAFLSFPAVELAEMDAKHYCSKF
jgi:hypothetical protein